MATGNLSVRDRLGEHDERTDTRLGVWSEAGRLRRVLVCSPGLAHLRLTPETCDELLFDDVIWVQQARRDHFDFVAKMRRPRRRGPRAARPAHRRGRASQTARPGSSTARSPTTKSAPDSATRSGRG